MLKKHHLPQSCDHHAITPHSCRHPENCLEYVPHLPVGVAEGSNVIEAKTSSRSSGRSRSRPPPPPPSPSKTVAAAAAPRAGLSVAEGVLTAAPPPRDAEGMESRLKEKEEEEAPRGGGTFGSGNGSSQYCLGI